MAIKALASKTTSEFAIYHGDCVAVLKQMPDACMGFSIYSPPFSNLFTYSDSECDMGNTANDAEFFAHYAFLLKELVRIMKPGRLIAVHCSDLPFTKGKDGVIGIKDFSGMLIRAHEEFGFVLHSRVTIRKSPVVEVTRTKALGLLYKQLIKDSSRSRQGMPDYLLVFRTPGENDDAVTHKKDEFTVDQWQEWAEPVWMDIRQTNTLNARAARDQADERHVCPLQLDLIERAITLWSNPGDTVLSPFMGIGSEGFIALQLKRKFLGVELKESYFKASLKHLQSGHLKASSFFNDASFD